MELTLCEKSFNELYNFFEHLVSAELVRLNVEVSVFARVRQTTLLFSPIGFAPVELAAEDRHRVRCVQKN